jgi:4-nitrophenyl phosphatase
MGVPGSDVVAVVCDLDGVIWLGEQVIEGAPLAVARLRTGGHRVVFVTNNSFSPVAEVEAKLASMGIPAAGDVITSAMAAASLVEAGERVLLLGGPGSREELERAGADVTMADAVAGARPGGDENAAAFDVVLVGFHRTFTYETLRLAALAVRAGARLIATNDDATYPTPTGPIPGGGAILAAVSTGAGVVPVVAGKPYPAMVATVRRALGEAAADLWAVGDRLDTDGRFAAALGVPFALVLTGVTRPDDPRPGPAPSVVLPDVAAFAAFLVP